MEVIWTWPLKNYSPSNSLYLWWVRTQTWAAGNSGVPEPEMVQRKKGDMIPANHVWRDRVGDFRDLPWACWVYQALAPCGFPPSSTCQPVISLSFTWCLLCLRAVSFELMVTKRTLATVTLHQRSGLPLFAFTHSSLWLASRAGTPSQVFMDLQQLGRKNNY